jgi:choline/glycine/proline betaine transport protein
LVCNVIQCGNGDWIVVLGISEPIYHFLSPPMAEGGTAEAAKEAMKFTFWGFHAWAVYALVGLSLAYFILADFHLLGLFYPFFWEIKFTVELEIDILLFFAALYLVWLLLWGWEFNKLQQG